MRLPGKKNTAVELEDIHGTSGHLTRKSSEKKHDEEVDVAYADADEELRLWAGIKRFPKLVSFCLGLSVAVIALGYDSMILGNITGVDSFQADYGSLYEGQVIIPAIWLSLWTGLGRLGNALGSVVGGWTQDFMGRKRSFMLGSIVLIVSVIISFLSFIPPEVNTKRGVFLAGKVLQGVSVGLLKITAMTYISENAPVSLRAPGMALFPTFNLLGQLLGTVVVFAMNSVPGKAGYMGAFGSQIPLALVPFVVSLIMPDSPVYLLRQGKEEASLRAAVRLYEPRVSAAKMIERAKAGILNEVNPEAGATYMDTFRPQHRRRTWIVFFANLYPTAFGLDHLGSISYFLQLLGMDSNVSLIFMISGVVVGIIANGMGIWILTRVGRRTAVLVSLSLASLLWGAMGISGSFSGVLIAYVSAAVMALVIFVSGLGVWPAGYAIIGETSALEVRAKTQAVGGVSQQASSTAMSIILPYIFNPDAGNSGAKLGWLFFGLCAITAIASWFIIPEMKGRSQEEIDRMFELELPARKFKHWGGEGSHED
ncbi:unnamed protein product [Clonostachys rosea]|uniref:Major facilitator superfamily (MFS) profile domain-containing protein n=1 Tax=Bionectria ochroleuca TaxID=29856 RepID=A0ABY6UND2_BIOOC|nr:unnamed protein product [Clonostachys rosea]